MEKSNKLSASNEVTRILLANAHLNNESMFNHIVERCEKRYKAQTPELYCDLVMITKECHQGRQREVYRYIVLILLVVIGFANFESGGILVAIFLAWIVEFTTNMLRADHVKKNFLPSTFNYEKYKNNSSHAIDQNVVISGAYSPFVGAGIDVNSWSFTVDLTKSESENDKPEELVIEDLYEEVTVEIKRLAIPNIVIKDKLFINGKDIRDDKRFLPDIMGIPVSHISQDIINEYIGKNDEKIRHYKVIEIQTWNGQLILSIFFRFTKIGEDLFAEARFFLLPPLNENFLAVDNLTKSISWRQIRNSLVGSMIKAPFTWQYLRH